MACPLGDWLNVVPAWGRIEMLPGCPFLNWTTTRS
jgi:hypothetical protein